MPPLRDPAEDVITITEAMLIRLSVEEGRAFRALRDEVHALFRRLPWPGNVRQLINVLRNVVVLQTVVTPEMLPADLFRQRDVPPAAALPPLQGAEESLGSLIGKSLAEMEQIVIEATIAHHGGSVPQAARTLYVSPSPLYRKREGWTKAAQSK